MFRNKGFAKYLATSWIASLFYQSSVVSQGVPFRFPMGRAWNGTANAGFI